MSFEINKNIRGLVKKNEVLLKMNYRNIREEVKVKKSK